MILFSSKFVKEKKRGGMKAAAFFSLFVEGFAVGALIHSGVQLVGAHQNAVQRAVVLALAVMCALLNGTLDALICLVCHGMLLLFLDFALSMAQKSQRKQRKNYHFLKFFVLRAMIKKTRKGAHDNG